MDYTIDRTEAADMIADFGQAVTLTRRAAGAYDPATGSAPVTTTTQSGKGVILPLSALRKGGDNIIEGDAQLLLSALTAAGTVLTAPHVDDTVTLADASVVSIIAVDPLNPAGTNILFDCVVRSVA